MEIATSEQIFDFKKVWFNEPVQHVFWIQNTTMEDLRIEDMAVTFPLRSSTKLRRVINPGERVQISVYMPDKNRPVGEYEGSLEIAFSNPQVEKVVFGVKGTIQMPIEVSPRPALFASTFRGEPKTASLQIINHEEKPLLIHGIQSQSDRFSVALSTNEPGQQYTLSFEIPATGPSGRRADEVILTTSSPRQPLLKIPANTLIKERVYASADAIELGKVKMRDLKRVPGLLASLTETVMVYQNKGKEFRVSAMTDLPFLNLTTTPSALGDRCEIKIELNVETMTPGLVDGNIGIQTNDPDFAVLNIPVRGAIAQ